MSEEAEIILTQLPLRIVVEFETSMHEQHPDYPPKHFPLTPLTNYWTLGRRFGTDGVEIRRRGYAMVPNYATTIDGVIGRSIEKGICDLGAWADLATPTKAMKGYIGLSRVRCANDLLVAQPFSPCLFTQGKQHWPELLLNVETGAVPIDEDFPNLCLQTDKLAQQSKKLKDVRFHCTIATVLAQLIILCI